MKKNNKHLCFNHEIIGAENIIENADMSCHSSFRVGGNADILIIADTVDILKYTLRIIKDNNFQYFLLGNGSNVVFKDKGFDGVVIKLGKDFTKYGVHNGTLYGYAASLLSSVSKCAMEHGLTGFEFASGIPGSCGGGVYMNAGAYGGEMKQIIKNVTVLNYHTLEEETLSCHDLKLSYRHSILEQTNDIIIKVTFDLSKGEKQDIANKMRTLLDARNEKQPINFPSCGSFFKRPEGYFAGKLIQDAGLKGLTIGGAQVSILHSGFIVNVGNATYADIVALKNVVQTVVKQKFNVDLETEVKFI